MNIGEKNINIQAITQAGNFLIALRLLGSFILHKIKEKEEKVFIKLAMRQIYLEYLDRSLGYLYSVKQKPLVLVELIVHKIEIYQTLHGMIYLQIFDIISFQVNLNI